MDKNCIKNIWGKIVNIDWIWGGFWVLFILSLWAVFSWGFGWIPLFDVDIAINTNVVNGTLALSYSYLAGCIFYMLTSLLPLHKKKRSNTKYLIKDIHDIGTEINNTIEIFKAHGNINVIVDLHNLKICKELLLSKRWDVNMGIEIYRGQDTYFKWFHSQVKKIAFLAVDIIAKYKEILSDKQIDYLFAINDKSMIQFLDIGATAGSLSDPATEMVVGKFIELINNFNALNNTLKKKYRRSSSMVGKRKEKFEEAKKSKIEKEESAVND